MCRILAIAPYESMRNLIVNLCADRPEIQLTALVGDLEEGAKLVQTIPSEDYDIIISRGGTAEIIRTVTSIPVIDISLSSYDVLSTIRLVENYPGKSAIVAYPSISKMARLICGVLQSDIPVYTLDSAQHLHGLIQSLNAQGFSLIIGDAVTTAYAQRCSLDAVLITSGIESLESTLNEALYIYELLSVQGAKEGLLRKITQGGNTYYAILDSKGNFCWENAALKEKHKLRQFFKNFTVDKIKTSGQNYILFLLEMLVKIGRHGRFNRDGGDILLRRSDALDDVVRARRCAEVEAQFVQPGLTQRTQIFLRAECAVGVHVLMNPGGAELADDIGIQFDFHERLQIDVADAGRSVRRAEQQVDILHAEVRPTDFPQPFADGLLAIQLAVIVAERAADVALVRLADGAQPRAGQAGRASLGKFRWVADEVCPPAERHIT